ncbi:MAG: hypothetical protein J3K34DRAFT_491316 [Monoraphidium minutum]|nr:MAG: hypothetical protein J3K34DRAFT_491316 [Monoraphidium minutum]
MKPVEITALHPSAALAAPGEPVVRLLFGDAPGAPELYVHPFLLRAWSGVLGPAVDLALLADQGGSSSLEGSLIHVPAAAAAPAGAGDAGGGAAAGGAAGGGGAVAVTLPLDDGSTAAWEGALGLMRARITWDSASGLLRLAHKYDMPGLTARIQEILAAGGCATDVPAFTAHLTDDTAFEWLDLTSRCGLDGLSDACAAFITARRLPLTLAALRPLPEARGDALLAAAAAREEGVADELRRAAPFKIEAAQLRAKNTELEDELDTAQGRLRTAATPSGRQCYSCSYPLFVKPNGKEVKLCSL